MKVAFRAANDKFVCAENGGDDAGVVRANRDAVGPWETWTVHELDGGAIALESSGGRFLSAEGGGGGELHANRALSTSYDLTIPEHLRTAIGPWETFTVIGGLRDESIGLRTVDGEHLVCAEVGSRDPIVNATRTEQGPWETFAVVLVEDFGPTVHGRLRVDGPQLRDDAGVWRWKLVTAFDAFHQFIDGRDVAPYLKWAIGVGANGVRVFGNWAVTAFDHRRYLPRSGERLGAFGDYWNGLDKFCEFCARFGLRVEFTAICDAIPPDEAAQRAFLQTAA